MKLYRDKRWLEFREEIIKLDGQVCTQCKRGKANGVTLQVHHKQYEKGKLPWEYPPSACETLCKGCHAREHGEIRPNSDWDYMDEDDLGSLSGECECCGTSIRYVFFIQHKHWEPISVGTICCDNLTGEKTATEHRKMLDRRKRFINSKRWKYSPKGIYIKESRIMVEIISHKNNYKIVMNRVKGQKEFPTEKEAKEKVFEVIQNGKAKKYLNENPVDEEHSYYQL